MMIDKVQVQGIAIIPGVSKNGIRYTTEELRAFAPTLIGRPILKDHVSETDNTIGIVETAYSDPEGNVYYNGWIKEDGSGIVEKIQDGRVKEVSIGAYVGKMVKENDDDDFLIATEMEGMELSTTPTPGVKGTSLRHSITQSFKGPIAEHINLIRKENDSINDLEDNKMAEDEVKELPKEEEPKVEDKPKEEPKEEVKEEPKAEKPTEAEESKKVTINVDTSKIDEALSKLEKVAELKEKLNMKEEVKEEVTKMENTKGKVAKEEAKEEVQDNYVVERSEYGEGVMIYQNPNADGTY